MPVGYTPFRRGIRPAPVGSGSSAAVVNAVTLNGQPVTFNGATVTKGN